MRNISKQVEMLEFLQRGDERGQLVIVEGMQDIPFDIKRVFYIYGSDSDVVRGQHANRKTEFVLINVAGSSKVRVLDVEMGEEFEYKIVGSTEANSGKGKISNESPVGRALMGAQINETVVVESPAGSFSYKILDIQRSN